MIPQNLINASKASEFHLHGMDYKPLVREAQLFKLMETKRCNQCEHVFDISFFSKKANNIGGVRHQCKNCSRATSNKNYKRFEYEKITDADGEVWLPVVGWEQQYAVSNYGRVKSIERRIILSNNTTQQRTEQLRKQNLNTHGYPSVGLRRNGEKQIQVAIHILVATAFIPNPENKPEVNHIFGIKTDNRVFELEWVTSKENSVHAWSTGLIKNRTNTQKQ